MYLCTPLSLTSSVSSRKEGSTFTLHGENCYYPLGFKWPVKGGKKHRSTLVLWLRTDFPIFTFNQIERLLRTLLPLHGKRPRREERYRPYSCVTHLDPIRTTEYFTWTLKSGTCCIVVRLPGTQESSQDVVRCGFCLCLWMNTLGEPKRQWKPT